MANGIKFVKCHKKNGIPYSWYVYRGAVSNSALYHNTDKNGRSTDEPYPMDRLPKYVRAFCEKHQEEHWSSADEYEVTRFM